MEVFRKGKTYIIAQYHRTDIVFSSHSREGKAKSCSQINTVICRLIYNISAGSFRDTHFLMSKTKPYNAKKSR